MYRGSVITRIGVRFAALRNNIHSKLGKKIQQFNKPTSCYFTRISILSICTIPWIPGRAMTISAEPPIFETNAIIFNAMTINAEPPIVETNEIDAIIFNAMTPDIFNAMTPERTVGVIMRNEVMTKKFMNHVIDNDRIDLLIGAVNHYHGSARGWSGTSRGLAYLLFTYCDESYTGFRFSTYLCEHIQDLIHQGPTIIIDAIDSSGVFRDLLSQKILAKIENQVDGRRKLLSCYLVKYLANPSQDIFKNEVLFFDALLTVLS
jgi:hypothetical protein